MQYQIGGLEIPRHPQPRAQGVLVNQQLIVIPAQACANRPFARANEVLHKRRLLKIRTVCREAERGRSPRIELSEVRDYIAELLAEKRRVRLKPGFPLLIAVMNGNRSFEISFPKAILLKNNNGSRKWIRREPLRIIPNHAM